MQSSSDAAQKDSSSHTDPSPPTVVPVLQELFQYHDQSSILDQIDALREEGVDEYVNIPQVIVCGDQSSGKSSVLEAISRLRFPRKESRCTTFATEVVLRRERDSRSLVKIVPGKHRTEVEKTRIASFKGEFTTPEDFPRLVEDAQEHIRSITNSARSVISDDILSVRISNPEFPSLTIVDLPGLIQNERREGSGNEVEKIRSIVRKYMENPLSIVLAVVSAEYDYDNQGVLALAQEYDEMGTRTIGVITMPDKLSAGGSREADFLKLAKSGDDSSEFRWHVLKNTGEADRRASADKRDADEREFFSRLPWSALPETSLGVDALRLRLSKILHQKVVEGLPSVMASIEENIKDAQIKASALGDPRDTLSKQRDYLSRIAQPFNARVQMAVNGSYGDQFFASRHPNRRQRRLRATIRKLNREFADTVRHKGHEWQVFDETNSSPFISGSGSLHPENPLAKKFPNPGQLTHGASLQIIDQMMEDNCGNELPGLPNPDIVRDFFQELSCRWEAIARAHIERVFQAVDAFLVELSDDLMDYRTRNSLYIYHIENVVNAKREEILSNGGKLEDILYPYRRGYPMTYNDEFQTKMARKSRTYNEAHRQLLDCSILFYEIARQCFIDNVALLAIEGCLISSLPDIFSPLVVESMSDDIVVDIASEPNDAMEERVRLERKLSTLKRGQSSCRRYMASSLASAPRIRPANQPNEVAVPQFAGWDSNLPGEDDPQSGNEGLGNRRNEHSDKGYNEPQAQEEQDIGNSSATEESAPYSGNSLRSSQSVRSPFSSFGSPRKSGYSSRSSISSTPPSHKKSQRASNDADTRVFGSKRPLRRSQLFVPAEPVNSTEQPVSLGQEESDEEL